MRTDVVKGLGVKLLDRVLDIMLEEDEERREVSGPQSGKALDSLAVLLKVCLFI